MLPPSYANLAVLAIANAFAFVPMPLMIFAASLIGSDLAPDARWATLPVTASIVGVAAGVWPVSQATARWGRMVAFQLFLWLGAGACLLASVAVVMEAFDWFCISVFLLGVAVSAVQQFRYAAIECLGADRAPTAASIILAGGIIAAYAGPELAVVGRTWTEHNYQGSFWLAAASFVVSSFILWGFKPAPVKHAATTTAQVPLRTLLNPALCLAIASGVVSYSVMSFIMTATPISMHHHFMHSLEDTKWVIQSHIMAMFLPSLISPLLFRWLGIHNMMRLGLLAYTITLVVGYQFTSVMGFWVQLVALGVGWNFLFVAGTALLPKTHLPQHTLKAQALNDGLIFGAQSLASICAGFAMSYLSWAGLISIGLGPMLILVVLMVVHQVTPSSSTTPPPETQP